METIPEPDTPPGKFVKCPDCKGLTYTWVSSLDDLGRVKTMTQKKCHTCRQTGYIGYQYD